MQDAEPAAGDIWPAGHWTHVPPEHLLPAAHVLHAEVFCQEATSGRIFSGGQAVLLVCLTEVHGEVSVPWQVPAPALDQVPVVQAVQLSARAGE